MAIDEFHAYLLHDRGCLTETSAHRRKRLRGFFPRLDVKLASLTPRRAEEIYRWNTTRCSVFGERRGGGPHQRFYLHKRVATICKQVGVPKVCTHSLRGLHATLAIAGGASTDYVASALGHTSFSMTERHYVDPEALQHSRSDRVFAALGTGQTGGSRAEELVRMLDAETLKALADPLAKDKNAPIDRPANPSPTVPPAP